MNVTKDIINDLIPLYVANECSADTRALVDEYLQRNPQQAEELRRIMATSVPASRAVHEKPRRDALIPRGPSPPAAALMADGFRHLLLARAVVVLLDRRADLVVAAGCAHQRGCLRRPWRGLLDHLCRGTKPFTHPVICCGASPPNHRLRCSPSPALESGHDGPQSLA